MTMQRSKYTHDYGLSAQGATFGIEMILGLAMAAMTMGMMSQGQQEAPPAPEPTKPGPMPDPNAKAISDAADAEKRLLVSSQDGRQGTNLSRNRSKAMGSSSSGSQTASAGTDYTNEKLG